MIKLRNILLNMALITGFTSTFANPIDCTNHCPEFIVSIPKKECAFTLKGGLCYLQPIAGNLGWSAITNFLPFVSPSWEIQTINPSYQPGFNLEALYTVPNSAGTDIQLNWTQLNTKDTQTVTVTPTLQWVSPFSQTGPGTGDTTYDPTGVGELTRAHASVTFDYSLVNLNVGKTIDLGCNMHLRIFSGLSYVRIQQTLNSTFTGTDPLPIISLHNRSKYSGVGPRLGFDTSYTICKGFSFVGELAGGLLFGSMQPAEYNFTGSSEALEAIGISQNIEQITSKSVSQTVPSIDAKLGINYAFSWCNRYLLTIEAGYRGAFYVNPLSGYETGTNVLPLELGSLSTNSMKHVKSDFSVNGPYIEIGLTF